MPLSTILVKQILIGLVILSSLWSPSSSSSVAVSKRTSVPSPCDGRPMISSNRRACGLFVWDLPSALLYKWCHYLVKDRIYEGRGGYLFVRYESNSILQLLYPCSRYSPNKCMVCGGSYPDHLQLWWSKHLYSPFDQYLDKTYNEAMTLPEDKEPSRRRQQQKQSSGSNRRTSGKKTSPSSSVQTIADPPSFHFHKRYVEDMSDIKEVDRTRLAKAIKKRILALPSNRNYDVCKVPGTGVMYATPGIGGFASDEAYSKRDALIDILTVMLRPSVDNLIFRQAKDFEEKKAKNNRITNRL